MTSVLFYFPTNQGLISVQLGTVLVGLHWISPNSPTTTWFYYMLCAVKSDSFLHALFAVVASAW